VKENVRKRPLDAAGGLGRQGAVRKRKGEVHEMNGHKFVQRQFYQLMLCAFCSDFLLNALGFQCEDCRYTCHKKCYEKVVTKCISKSNAGVSSHLRLFHISLIMCQDDDEEKINHRIPHRFEPLTNMGANWCCHCGYMLPLGRKNARKCSECDITCHANCAHLVPDFCGMSMETANQLLRDLRDINRARGGRAATIPGGKPSQATGQYSHGHSNSFSQQPDMGMGQLSGPMDRLKLTGAMTEPADPYGRPTNQPQPDRYTQDPRFTQQQQQQGPGSYADPRAGSPVARPPPGARIPIPPGYPQQDQQVPLPGPGKPLPGYEHRPPDGYPGPGHQVL
jgi:hypothetical protein